MHSPIKQNATLGYNSNMRAEPCLVNVRCVLIVEENRTRFRRIEAREELCNSRLSGARATNDEGGLPGWEEEGYVTENRLGRARWVCKGDVGERQLASTAYGRDLMEELWKGPLCTLLRRR